MINRRNALSLMSAATLPALSAPTTVWASGPREIIWDELIPAGVPYSEIIGEGEMDIANDTWVPVYDENGFKMNEALEGALIKMPGFIVPFESTDAGITEFLLVPYFGACIHMPPPPANQLVMVTTKTPWVTESLWDPVWVTGHMSLHLQSTTLGQAGYALDAEGIEIYLWE